MVSKVVVVGGGWSGVAASLAVVQGGGEAILLERSDMLLGSGLVGGIMRNNGRFTATEEGIAMGMDLFQLIDGVSRHKNIQFPGHKHASLYDVALIEPVVRRELLKSSVEIHLKTLVKGVNKGEGRIFSVVDGEGNHYSGDAFLDTTGTAGPQKNCHHYGNGCVMCMYRCPTFGPRKSLTGLMEVEEYVGQNSNGSIGSMSGSCKLFKESLSQEIVEELNRTGVSITPLPLELINNEKLGFKACQQYSLKEFAENVILLDTSHAKLMVPYFPLEALRTVPGFENARYEDPYAGGIGNSIRYIGIAPRDNTMQVKHCDNLFCAGEKAGLLVGHTEAIVTGYLAGRNALALAVGQELLEISKETAIGMAIEFVNGNMKTQEGRRKKYTFSGSVLFQEMKKRGLYSTEGDEIKKRVKDHGLLGLFHKSLL